MKRYRTGSHWPVTIIETDNEDGPGLIRRHDNDRLIATAQTPEDAQRIVDALNAVAGPGREAGSEPDVNARM